MSGLMKGLKLTHQIVNRNPAVAFTLVRNHWNKDFKPAPFPGNEKEREAAAKKYNLSKEEYKPYADDGLGFGDYPKLPDVPVEARDPYYPYDQPALKRNFNEPLHAEIDVYSQDRYGMAEPLRYSVPFQFTCFMSIMAACFAIYYYLNDKKMFRPVTPRQYPSKGPHYTFETK